MSTCVIDIESDGLLDTITKIHCVCWKDTYENKMKSYDPTRVEEGLLELSKQATQLVGHNIIGFDLNAIEKIYPNLSFTNDIFDTMIASQLVFANMMDLDARNVWQYAVPKELWGKHSLESWGYRLGKLKGDYGKKENAWSEYRTEMLPYCQQDVEITSALYEYLLGEQIPWKALYVEQRFQYAITKQEIRGILVDQDAMFRNVSLLDENRIILERKLQEIFPPRLVDCGEVTPKVNSTKFGYRKDCTLHRVEIVDFNPNSGDHVIARLTELGWTPVRWTDGGKDKDPTKKKPKTSEEDIEDFEHPSVKVLLEYKKVTNCLTKIYTGKESWFNHIAEDGRLHGGVYAFGTGTRRCSHSPNTTQLAKNDYFKKTSLEGKITPRDMCIPKPGMVQLGADASALELCCLANYLDDPAYTYTIVSGKSEDGTDIHSMNMKALIQYIDNRDKAKKFIYAFNYGAGNAKLGAILGGNAALGKQARTQFLDANPKLKTLIDEVKEVAKKRGYIYSIDGSKIYIPKNKQGQLKEYVAINYLLQSCGAIIMKVAYANLFIALSEHYTEEDGGIIMYNHDEFQVECRPEIAEHIGQLAVKAIADAGTFLDIKCPLTGDFKIGANWAVCH